jgi:hypothetical protein
MRIKTLFLLVSHLVVGTMGVVLGIYLLPIITAPVAPTASEISSLVTQAQYKTRFISDLTDSDILHWGEGDVAVGPHFITLAGTLAPGPDYQLYLASEFVETEADFMRLKSTMVRVGEVKTFENFIVPVPQNIDPAKYNTVIVWCESFNQFITSAQYQR